jgi:putative phage-type endonuclease
MVEIRQGTPEWFQARLGYVTASRVADVVARTKTGWGASRANYMAQLIAERLTGVVAESYTNAAMQWGTETEPQARAAYAFYRDADVTEVGFVLHPTIGEAGASPDGLVGDDGLVEIKCPETKTHIDTLLGQEVPGKYVIQMQWQMACTGRKWCDFVSFDPRLPEAMSLFVKRVERDDEHIAELEREVIAFLNELRDKVARLRAKYDLEPMPEAAQMMMAG